jgi:pimeloyl-ACP methyl ester carboxylesterase
MSLTKPKCFILHGNNSTTINDGWYLSLSNYLNLLGYSVDIRDYPENIINNQEEIIKTLKNLGCDENSIIIGHSSGAQAALRYSEIFKVLGLIIITPYVTHMNNSHEKESGYFDKPWDPLSIQQNCKWILQVL